MVSQCSFQLSTFFLFIMFKLACLLFILYVVAYCEAAPGRVWNEEDTLSAVVGQIVKTHSSSGASSSHGGLMDHERGYEASRNGQRFGNGQNTGAFHGGHRTGGGSHANGYEPNCSRKFSLVSLLLL